MKRLRVDETVKEGSGSPTTGIIYHRQSAVSTTQLPLSTLSIASSLNQTLQPIEGSMQSGIYSPAAPVKYGAMPTATAAPHSAKPQTAILSGHAQLISNSSSNASSPPNQSQESPQQQQQQSPAGNFQRLKVEDALSYLDLVKFKFGSKPQVYNDFLDIMKEFKSQSIDTPGVIQRVSNLFKGFPELIVGFNTFLPPGYKIEVQKSDQGYAFQVSVSMPSPTGTLNSDPQQQRSAMIMKGSGPITVCPATVAAPPPPPPPAPPTQPPVTAIAHISPVVPPPVPVAAALAVQHHSSNFTGSAPTYGLSLAQAAVALQGNTADGPQNQPVEFNHAINYVNKIKNRFQGQPEKYKKFLEILHTYQKEQRTLKDTSSVSVLGSGKHLTEQEVYSQVAKLFENQSDLLAEFGQFLPDATSHINQAPISEHSNSVKKTPGGGKPYRGDHLLDRHISHKQSHISGPVKRSESYQNYRDAPPPKKHKLSSNRDVTLTEAGKHGTLNDYAFFDKARKAFRTSEEYNNFLRCLILFNQEVVSKSELIHIVTPFLGKFPELFKWFKDFLGQNDMVETIPYNVARSERPQGDHALEIDLATAKRLGASYCIIPKAQEGLLCSGRTQLCREVLNDQWVSFPTWSEDSTFVSSRKTQYEEYMYRCEDERFELDVVIETNASTIRVLEGVHKKISRMSQDDISKFKLDDCLGGSSPTLHQRALKRIYGDKAPDIIDGLKRNPLNAVPVVLRRMKAKEEEWREAQKGFNKIWREQNEKYYLKSLDHQGINFKQTDVKALRSKSLFNEIETLFDERHEQNELGAESITGPHLVLPYKDRTILDDASNLFIHHIKRQSGIQKGEKKRIKHLIRQYLPDLFFHPRQQLSDDEREDEDENDEDDDSPSSSPSADSNGKGKGSLSPRKSPGQNIDPETEVKNEPLDLKEDDLKVPLHAQTSYSDEAYTLFMANNHWYIFLRLHAILCERLAKIYERACTLASEEQILRSNRKESTAVALRLKPKPQIEVEDYYVAFLDMVKNLLDGNMESNTYEDTLREMFGIHAYIAFTLDKVVSYAVRQLQHCVTERTAIACTDLFLKEQKRGAAGGPCATAYKRAHAELAYQRSGEKAVQDETCFKIYIYKRASKITIELLDTEPEESKKVDDVKKWSQYKECYADCANTNNTNKSPAFLSRNLRLYKRRLTKDKRNNNEIIEHENSNSNEEDQNNRDKAREGDALDLLDLIELRNMREERAPPERNQSQHPGYDVSDDTECKFNPQDTKITYTVNKSSYMYKISAFYRARKTHPGITKYKSSRFRGWLKQWAGTNVSEVQQKQCTDWMMGRCDGVVPNRTRVLTDNDLSRSPYVPYNRYRVDRLSEDST